MDGAWRFEAYNPTHHLGDDIKGHWTDRVRLFHAKMTVAGAHQL